jgi:hypothetical protein
MERSNENIWLSRLKEAQQKRDFELAVQIASDVKKITEPPKLAELPEPPKAPEPLVQETVMNEIQKKLLYKALRYLLSVGCKFAVIDPDGNKHGDLPIIEKENKKKITRAPKKYEHGTVTNYLRPFLLKLDKVGATVDIPFGEFDFKTLGSTLSSWTNKHYGEGAVEYKTLHIEKIIQLQRI